MYLFRMSKFEVHPNIAKAKTISTDFYLQQEFFDKSRERIFANAWQFVGDTDQVREVGWVTPVNLLEHYINEPLLLSRDKNGTVNCLSNVCTHRGNLLVEKPCKLHDIRCKYHGRRFNLDGKFLSMPEFREVENFPTADDDLTKLPVFTWGKWIFTSLNQAKDPKEFFGQMMDRMSW